MTLARFHYLGFSPVFAPLDLRSHRRGCRFQLGYTPIAIRHKSELRTAAWEAYGIGWVCKCTMQYITIIDIISTHVCTNDYNSIYIYEYCHVLSISFPFRFCKWAEVFAGIRSA